MLRSLEIRNYRNLRHLTIEKLGRVNLLVGKNNTGKTSVLEAASIYCQEANLQWISQIFEERGETSYRTALIEPEQQVSHNIELLTSIFYGRECKTDLESSIKIISSDKSISLQFVYFIREMIQDDESEGTYSKITIVDSQDDSARLGLEVTNNTTKRVFNLDNPLRRFVRFGTPKDNVQFVRTSNIVREANGQLWDKITLTEKQDYVENALRIIENDIQQLAFINPPLASSGGSRNGIKVDSRVAVSKMKDVSKPVSLRSMGDGINRILTIILAMVNCENGYLFIDEFENGLHYSVQEKLWEIIFYLAERLNIQVFATTHSLDCVDAFSAILNDGKQDKNAGAMIRLENYEGNIEATVYDADEIQATTRVHVDPR